MPRGHGPRGGLRLAHRIRLPRWARERGAALNDFPTLEPRGTALVNIDMQTAFLAEDQPYGNAHARDQLAAAEWLGEIIVSAGLEQCHFIGVAHPNRKHQNRHCSPGA